MCLGHSASFSSLLRLKKGEEEGEAVQLFVFLGTLSWAGDFVAWKRANSKAPSREREIVCWMGITRPNPIRRSH